MLHLREKQLYFLYTMKPRATFIIFIQSSKTKKSEQWPQPLPTQNIEINGGVGQIESRFIQSFIGMLTFLMFIYCLKPNTEKKNVSLPDFLSINGR